jgi:excisionase family DNA binding protein
MQKQEAPSSVKLLLTMEEAAQALGVGRTFLYTLVMKKEIASIKIGRARRIPVSALEQFIAEQLQQRHFQEVAQERQAPLDRGKRR